MGWCGVERVHDKSRAKGRHLAFGGRGGGMRGTSGAALGRGLMESPIGPEGGAILEWRGPGRLAWEMGHWTVTELD